MLKPAKRRLHPGLKQRRFRQRLVAYREAKGPRGRRQIPRAAVPSFFTLMNLFCGFLSLTQAMEGRFEYAAWLIILAGFFDILDGMMARITDGSSLFGVELDSLADIVSFGVAPAFLIYVFGLSSYGIFGVIVASLPAVCGAVRLAKYNVAYTDVKFEHFEGLPIPGMAAAIIAIILNAENVGFLAPVEPGRLPLLIPVVVILSVLMLTNFAFDTVPKPSARYMRAHPLKAILYGLAVVLMVVFRELGLLAVLFSYLVIGIGRAIYRFVRAVLASDPDLYADR
ncbi:MAG: CDP-diacylglycerol--serine O-phosphatidyltransferase [Bacteroidetes bacterium]|nr:CDP-diacylglycerol--serine O-phosphatidyltransferase [Bacteroidota bacterium]MCH8246767.1 CDP-diacylglycerol--serine O-phosphatidyltransferase [Bacteroidota bacterium]